ncbi:hypothetical protein HpSLK40_14080 [Helicobacter pylori]
MALDLSKYTMEERFIPVFLLLDTSGSMNESLGDRTRIGVLNLCIQKMIETLKQEAKKSYLAKWLLLLLAEMVRICTRPLMV